MNIEAFEIWWTLPAIEHIARHNVDIDEVESCIFDNAPKVFKTYRNNEERLIIYCQCPDSGRYLMIVTTMPEDGFIRIVTARDMTKNEKFKYKSQL